MKIPADNITSAQRVWEEAYRRFETPEEEIRKFATRLHLIQANRWSKEARILELCCGRGNGLHALHRLGFCRIVGIDLSSRLLAEYKGQGYRTVGDCRQLPFNNNSQDIIIVQGGLHHLDILPDDLRRTLGEAHRVLNANGLFVAIEPWSTPFLTFVHGLCRFALLRKMSSKLDALATMIRYEQQTYDQWLNNPSLILETFNEYFSTQQMHFRFGKLYFVGSKMEGLKR